MHKKINFCRECGEKLVMDLKNISGYDEESGKPYYNLKCPKLIRSFWSYLWSPPTNIGYQIHTSIPIRPKN